MKHTQMDDAKLLWYRCGTWLLYKMPLRGCSSEVLQNLLLELKLLIVAQPLGESLQHGLSLIGLWQMSVSGVGGILWGQDLHRRSRNHGPPVVDTVEKLLHALPSERQISSELIDENCSQKISEGDEPRDNASCQQRPKYLVRRLHTPKTTNMGDFERGIVLKYAEIVEDRRWQITVKRVSKRRGIAEEKTITNVQVPRECNGPQLQKSDVGLL